MHPALVAELGRIVAWAWTFGEDRGDFCGIVYNRELLPSALVRMRYLMGNEDHASQTVSKCAALNGGPA